MKHNVFVYGTLRSEGSNPAPAFVEAEVVGPAIAPGVIYNLGWYPGFKRESKVEGESFVQGELIRVSDEALERLDAYEGCPSLYRREEMLVRDEEGQDHIAYVYVYNGSVHEDDIITHGDFIAYTKGND